MTNCTKYICIIIIPVFASRRVNSFNTAGSISTSWLWKLSIWDFLIPRTRGIIYLKLYFKTHSRKLGKNVNFLPKQFKNYFKAKRK